MNIIGINNIINTIMKITNITSTITNTSAIIFRVINNIIIHIVIGTDNTLIINIFISLGLLLLFL